MNARLPSGPCLCGAKDCASCGPAQGYTIADPDDCDITAEELQIVSEMLDDAELAHNAGNDEDARRILREVIAALEEFAED